MQVHTAIIERNIALTYFFFFLVNYQPHWVKFHNSDMYFEQRMPSFGLKKSALKFFLQVTISKTNAGIELKLQHVSSGL